MQRCQKVILQVTEIMAHQEEEKSRQPVLMLEIVLLYKWNALYMSC